jgi:RNA polymerase sigma-70 factor (ECF subfamily)
MALPEPDPDVLARAKRGDREAFGDLVDVYARLIFNVAYRMTGRSDEAADLSQEIFLRAYRNLHLHDGERPFGPWLYRLGHNLGINWVTRRRPTPLPLDARTERGGALHEPADAAPDAPAQAEAGERAVQVRAAVLRLPPEQRAIITLHYFQGLSYEELVETLELPLGTVKNRLFRARSALKGLLDAGVPA